MNTVPNLARTVLGRRVLAVLTASVLAAGALVALNVTVLPEVQPAQAASGADFNAGNIMSDAVFYDAGTMNVSQVQAFLNSRVPSCRAGYTCLKDFRQNTTSQSAKAAGCAAYGGAANQSAAQIIASVASICGINPQVLIVLLEKEQGLVTDTWPTERQFRSATGYGCPDTADCDALYYGFFNQVYNAAWQFKKYQASPDGRGYQAGRWNTIQWHPNSACGSSQVYIENQATAGLYLYTPYRPNQAALNNMYGTGDGCSSYGNRNFFRMFTDWFGSTTGGAYFARTSANPTLYLLAGTVKYPVPSMEVYEDLNALGTYRVVSQSYLDTYSTSSKWATTAVRDPISGAVYLAQRWGSKNQFPSCELMAQYGYSCGDAIDLTPGQLARWSTGGMITPFFVIPGSADLNYFVPGGRVHVYDWATAVKLNGGSAPYVVTMRTDVVPRYPLLKTILNPQTLVKSSSSDAVYFVDGFDRKIQITSFAVASEFGANGFLTVPQGILDGYTTGPGFLSLAVRCNGATYVAAGARLHSWTGSAANGGLAVAEVSADTCQRLPRGGAITGELFVKTATSSTVYLVTGGKLRAMSSWDELLANNNGVVPSIMTVSAGTLLSLPLVPTLEPASVVKSSSDPMLYFIDGAEKRIPVSSFVSMTELGRASWSTVPANALSSYSVASGYLTRVLSCNGRLLLGVNGTLHPITASNPTGITVTNVASDTCARLKISTASELGSVFVKTIDSPTVYFVAGAVRRPVASWDRLLELAGGSAPVILTTGAGGLGDIPLGPSA